MEQQKNLVATDGASHPASVSATRHARWGWWAAMLLLFCMLVPTAAAQSFVQEFPTPPAPGMSMSSGVNSFDMVIDGQVFTFATNGPSLGWQPSSVVVMNDSSTTFTIKRRDGNTFILNRLDFDTRFSPEWDVTLQVFRGGIQAAPSRTFFSFDPIMPQSYPSVEVNEIRFTAPSLRDLNLMRFLGTGSAAPAPTITGLSPNSGSTGGGNQVMITGTGFTSVSGVRFGASLAAYSVNSATQIMATVPPNAAGSVSVSVTTASGTSVMNGSSLYTYIAPPVVTSISPTSGSQGTTVLIRGTGFIGATAVTFGGAVSGSYVVDSDTQMRASAPAGTGTVDVRVTTPGGTSATSAADQFTYASVPTVTNVAPSVGPQSGLRGVVITGTNFAGATGVSFGGTPAVTFGINSNTQITAVSPPGTGTVDIRVTSAAGTSATSAADQYTYVPAPVVTAVAPSSGTTTGGTTVIITGSNFAGTTGVLFANTPATGYVVNSNTQITATSPAGTGTVDVRVVSAGGGSATSAADQFTYVAPAPTVTAVSPRNGPGSGGNTLEITGTGFLGATAVTFGGIAAEGFAVDSDTRIRAEPPAGTGTVNVQVTVAGLTSATGAANEYTYGAAPTITSVAPSVGPTVGGTTVLIRGTGFSGVTNVAFGGASSPAYAVDNDTQIRANAPAGTGTVDIRVSTANGTSAVVAADQFTYVPAPTVTAVSPTAGPSTGGTSVTITGTNLAGATAVSFGGSAATGYTINSPTQITATAPAGTGTVDIRVTTIGGTSATSAADQFTYITAPTVTAVSPTAGPTTGGTTVTITGTNLAGATAVSFGGSAAIGYTINSATQITATAPAGTGTVDIRVTTTGGTSATSAADQFTYIQAPTVTSVSPTAGPTTGGTTVTITGSNLSGATAVSFGGTAASGYTVNSATQITATAPAGTGTVDIRVTTAGGTSATSAADQFTYIAAPTVTSVSPSAGPTTGGTTVTISGSNFSGATAVSFGGTAASGYTVNSATQITATAPAGTGTVDIRVTTAGGTSATSAADQFTYVAAPTVTAVSPSSGPATGGDMVTITGTNFAGATSITFGGTSAMGYGINSPTEIIAIVPPGTGTVDVRVTTTGGTSATSAADQFTYIQAPTVTSVSPTSGPTTGGTTVIITGTHFGGATAVTFGGAAATGYTVNSATQITATAPAGTGTADIRVTTAGGTSAIGASEPFTYIAAPTITSVLPSSGPTTGGTTVIIIGSNFGDATAVSFGGTAATGYTVNSATQITATAPAGTGTVDIRVTTTGGTSATSVVDQFTYVDAPTVVALSPATGPAGGGTSVTITGTNLSNATAVVFGSTAAAGYTVLSSTQITATAPAQAAGQVNVRVVTVGGTSATGAGDLYTYVAGPVAGDVTTGDIAPYNDGSSTPVSFNLASYVSNAPTSYAVTSATTTLGGSVSISNSGQVTYTAPVGVRAQSDSFGYTATNVGGTSNQGTVTVGIMDPSLTVTLGGSGQAHAALSGVSISIAGGRAPYSCATTLASGALPAGVQVNADCSLSGTPTVAGNFTFSLTVTDSSNTPYTTASSTLTLVIAAAPLPEINAISPTVGSVSGGTSVVINGAHFNGATSVMFGTTPASSYTVNSGTQITAESPNGFAGGVDVTVTTASGTSAITAAGRFTYIGTPIIDGLSPASGPTSGGTTVTLTGSNLSDATAVTFGGTPAASYTILGNTQITAIAPANSAGTVNVRVTTIGGTSPTGSANQYTYVSAPVATSYIHGTVVPYNEGGNTPLSFSVAGQVSNAPTSFTVASATTTLGGAVSIDNAGQVTYTAPVGRRAVNDSFQYTASNAGGTSNPATVTLSLGNPTLTAALGGTGTQGSALSGVAITVNGGRAPYTCATTPVSGVLPTGVQLNADCSLSGTPTQSGSFTFATNVTDSSNAAFTASSGSLTLSVDASAPGAPTIGTATVTATGAVTVTFSAPASDGGSPITSYTVIASPGGARVSGTGSPLTVTGLTAGTSYTFSVTATNAAGTSDGSSPSNTATPVAALVVSPVSATIGYDAPATPIALIINGTPTTVTVVTQPTHGIAEVSGTGIQYTPTPGYAGADSFTYRASDAFSTSAPATVSITVTAPTVALEQATLAQGSTSAAYSQTLQATGGTAPYTYAVTTGALPAGVTLQSNGTLSGRATVAGTFTFTVTATDSSSGEGPFSASRGYSLVIVAPTVVLDMPDLPEADGAEGYSQQLTASGGTAPYQFALRSGRLPAGLTLSASGEVSGEPTESGTFTFDVQVTDANGFGGSRTYTFVVQAAEQAISAFVATPEAPVYSPGGTFTVSASGGASSQPVVFASDSPAVCSVQGSTVTMLSAGTCVLTANQAGDALYAAAPQQRLEVVVASATPVITWVSDLSKVYGEDAFDLPAPQSNSPGAFTFTSSDTAVATINGRTVTLQGDGTTTITATQAASAGYAAATVQVQLVVAARPDPTTDQNVVSSLQAQVDSTVRFAQVQQANIRERLRQVRTGTNASSMNVVMAYAGGNGRQGLSVPVGNGLLDAPALPQGWGAWAAGTMSFGSSGRGRTSADFNTGGITIGADRAIGENVLLGLAGSWGRQDTEFDGNPSTTDADQRSLAVYGLWRAGEHVFVDAMLASGKLDFTMNRWSEAAAASARSTREGDQLFGSLTFGYEHRTTTGTTLTTYGRYDGHKAELDPYREQGLGVYDLSYGRQDVENSALAVGLEGTHAFKSDRVTWRPHWSLEYRTALDDRSDVAMNYVQRPAARDYLLAMHSYNDDTLSVGAGVDLQFDSGWMFSLLIGHDQGRNTLRSNSIGFQVRYGAQSTSSGVRSRPQGNDRLGALDGAQGCRDMEPGCMSPATQPMQPMQTGAR